VRRRRAAAGVELPPERLWRFSVGDWLPLVDESADSPSYEAFRAYMAERAAWCEARGITPAELSKRIPPPVVVDRPAWVRRRDGEEA